ncbi:MAG TPA: DUF4147 domain-containing protein [Verrucomicrobiae bacterium]|nr:DUF4147 domain-containing protein [Verrucomicrobiae bacterium]
MLKRGVRVGAGKLSVERPRGRISLPLGKKIYLLGIGKGADTAAPYFSRVFGARLKRGIFIVRDRVMRRRLPRIDILVAGHPLPDSRGIRATRRSIEMLSQAGAADTLVVFLMGGASSLLVGPAPGLTLGDKRRTAALLLKSGMSIDEMNTIRKHLSSVKGGGLLRAAQPAKVITLAISDVIGNDPAVIGSGPTYPDPSTFNDALKIIRRYRLMRRLPTAVRRRLVNGARGNIPETMKPGSALLGESRFVMLADNATALAAAKGEAEALGLRSAILTSTLSGDARARARELADKLKALAKKKSSSPRCFLLGGETTVKVRGGGTGGRNQEFALAAALELADCPGIYLLTAASDGSDGPTDAAGAFVDGATLRRAQGRRLNAARALRRNDSHAFFSRLGDLYRPGPTGTNVLDFVIAIVDGRGSQ